MSAHGAFQSLQEIGRRLCPWGLITREHKFLIKNWSTESISTDQYLRCNTGLWVWMCILSHSHCLLLTRSFSLMHRYYVVGQRLFSTSGNMLTSLYSKVRGSAGDKHTAQACDERRLWPGDKQFISKTFIFSLASCSPFDKCTAVNFLSGSLLLWNRIYGLSHLLFFSESSFYIFVCTRFLIENKYPNNDKTKTHSRVFQVSFKPPLCNLQVGLIKAG